MTTAFSPALAVLETAAFNPTDRHLVSLLLKLSGKDCPALGLAAALVSRQLADGHSCISLDTFISGAPTPSEKDGDEIAYPHRIPLFTILIRSFAMRRSQVRFLSARPSKFRP